MRPADATTRSSDRDHSSPRVVSLAPSATATVSALGATDRLVGVTHHCSLPAETAPQRVGGWLTPDLDAVEELTPDVVLTSDSLQADLAETCSDRGFTVAHREPATLELAIETVAARGEDIGRPAAGTRLAVSARQRLDRVADAVAGRPQPTVYCEEWSDPPMAAGNWVPDAVRAAGGRYPFVDSGERSHEVSLAAVERADPDHVVVHICGHGDRIDPQAIADRDWAVDAPIHVIDDSLLNQPSPALIDGIERLAGLLHPEAYSYRDDNSRYANRCRQRESGEASSS